MENRVVLLLNLRKLREYQQAIFIYQCLNPYSPQCFGKHKGQTYVILVMELGIL